MGNCEAIIKYEITELLNVNSLGMLHKRERKKERRREKVLKKYNCRNIMSFMKTGQNINYIRSAETVYTYFIFLFCMPLSTDQITDCQIILTEILKVKK